MEDFNLIFNFYGFRQCINDYNVNFVKVDVDKYLVFRTLSKGKITDLLLETYNKNSNPCISSPISDKMIKQGFDPKVDKI